MSKPFTVVICTYNGSKNIKEVLDSICACYELDKLVDQVIVVDNASTDNLKNIVLSYIKQNDIVTYVYEGRSGLSYARQNALLSKTEWVVYFDDDNLPSKNWFVDLKEKIDKEPNLGVLGGRNIAVVRDALSKDQLINLKTMKANLACHYSSMEDYQLGKNGVALKSIFGAGMTVRTSILRKFMENGWTKGIGRKKDSLGAYEDSEIVNYAINAGYGAGYCDTIYLLHILPAKRLESEYLFKLRRGMEKSEFDYILASDHPLRLRCKAFLRDIKKLIKYVCVWAFSKNEEKRRFSTYILISSLYGIRTFIPHILSACKLTLDRVMCLGRAGNEK